ncbi:hypothetical protein B9Z36_10340 [Limnohabitans sp. Rim8]|uniref:OmpW/AlkL family protein n=1 Tax=Limnohabitans sp. Rim8 TaxID=1100718 RepID=UPI000D340464|nr:OmpW family outer membrane protein [Limnohabitans sp. Rim8]PUE56682.1 hypothetical protein B9Z36_10340 [Limnohabitans sp. Rim8]
MTSMTKIALACAALVAASGAFAQKAGDNIVSVGLAYISPQADVGKLTNSTIYTPTLAGASASVPATTTISASWLHMYTDNVGAEFTLGIPPEFKQDLTVNGTTHKEAAKLKIHTPAAVAKYFFGNRGEQLRPYLGVGVSRVSFHNVSTQGDALVMALSAQSASFTSSWVPVYTAGAIYNIDDKWSVNGSVAYLPIKTTATFVGAAGTTTGDVKLNTTDYVIRLGYRF